MNTDDRAKAIAMLFVWLIGLSLFVWSWSSSGSLIAALIVTIVAGFFLAILLGPIVAAAAFILSLIADFIWPPDPRP